MRNRSMPTGVPADHLMKVGGHTFHDPALAEAARIAQRYDMKLSLFKPAPTGVGSAAQQQSAQIVPGALYGVPGLTNPVEQFDSTESLVTAGSGSNQVPVNGISPLEQTDVVLGWELFTTYSIADVPDAGSGQTIAISPFAPFTIFGPCKLSLQNQYAPIDVLSGRDLGIFQSYRPRYQRTDRRNANLASPVLGAAYGSGVWAEAALLEAANVWSTTYITAGTTFVMRLPASIEFDYYYPLDIQGNVVGNPGRAIVSPQYMGGTTRIVTPQLTLASGLGGGDISPFTTTTLTAGGDTASTFPEGIGTSISIRRNAIYSANNPQVLPPVQPWQYALHTWQFPIGSQSKVNIPVPNDVGQILSIWVLLWDPAAASGAGAAIAMSAVSTCQLKYGSGLFRFDDTPATMQARWIQQHQALPPAGFIGWDCALNPDGRLMNNGGVLNTLTTNAINVALALSSPGSSSTYAVVGTEALQYVVPQ